MFKKILKILGGLCVLVIAGVAVGYIATNAKQPASNSNSAQWLQSGPYAVGISDFVFVDESRPTDENRGVPAKPERTLTTTIWYPDNLDGPHPLIVHSHGILSSRLEFPYLMEALASHGYIVAAADFPLSAGTSEGGATADDVINQPADVSFLIDSVLALTGDEKPFAGEIDRDRIGVSGYSLGGLTTNLVTYHARLRDPRIHAAVTIAGVSAPFSPAFFSTTTIPYLSISGTADAIIEFRRNASDIPQRVSNAALVAIEGGNHLGYLAAADPTFRFMDNPDTLGCAGVVAAVGENPNEVFSKVGTVAEGVDMNRDLPGLCDYGYTTAIHPGRQQMINQIAVLSFFESVFNTDPAEREAAREELTQYLAQDFAEARFSN